MSEEKVGCYKELVNGITTGIKFIINVVCKLMNKLGIMSCETQEKVIAKTNTISDKLVETNELINDIRTSLKELKDVSVNKDDLNELKEYLTNKEFSKALTKIDAIISSLKTSDVKTKLQIIREKIRTFVK